LGKNINNINIPIRRTPAWRSIILSNAEKKLD
jgi:hypothetical protein